MELKLETSIDKPPQEIYQFLLDKENIGLWLSNFKQYISISGDEDEEGSKAWYIFYFNKTSFKFEQEILKLIPNQRINYILRHPYVDIDFDIRLVEQKEESTKVMMTADYQSKSPVFNIYWLIRSGHLKKRHARDLHNLKLLCSKLISEFEIPEENQ